MHNYTLMLVLAAALLACSQTTTQTTADPAEADFKVLPPGSEPEQTPVVVSAPTPKEEARVLIQSYEESVAANPQAEDSPAYLFAAANLSVQKLQDYERAAGLYAQLLSQYPQWGQRGAIYAALANSYKLMGQLENARVTYLEMMREFPEGSQEHLLAQTELGLVNSSDVATRAQQLQNQPPESAGPPPPPPDPRPAEVLEELQ